MADGRPQEARAHHADSASPQLVNEFNPHSPESRRASRSAFRAIGAAESVTLENGLQVVVVPDSSSVEMANTVWYKAGSAQDPVGESGLAHFVEHLTFGELEANTETAHVRILRVLGDKQDAFTTFDYTVFYQLVTAAQLPAVMALEARRMSSLKVDVESLNAERLEVREEQREQDRPDGLLDAKVRAAIYKHHPYGNPVLGHPAEFENLSARDAIHFHQQWYGPNNAILVLQGGRDIDLMRKLAQQTFGAIKARPLGVPTVRSTVAPKGIATVLVRDSRAQVAMWRRDYLVPSHTAGETHYAVALQLLAELLGGGREGRLHQALVERKKLALTASVDYEADSLHPSTFSLVLTTKSGADLDALGKAVDDEVNALATHRLSAESLAHAKQDLKTRIVYSEEKIPPAARLVGEALVRGRRLEDVKDWPLRVDAVTAEQIRVAARNLLILPRLVTGLLSPVDLREGSTMPAMPDATR